MNQSSGRRVHRLFTAGSVSLNVALGAGIVMYGLGSSSGEAVTAGGGAFVAVMMLALAIISTLQVD